ncbi:MAG: lysine-2,3-aminomutase-like protein [Alphaproteobacteria bacterium]
MNVINHIVQTLKHRTLRSGADLAGAGLIDSSRIAATDEAAATLPIAVTSHMAALIDGGDAADPIARQFIPDPCEQITAPDELADPIGDEAHCPVKGIVHRHPDRALLKPVMACPVYCRFCFRREAVAMDDAMLSPGELATALDYISAHGEIWEVILTGGDPLILSPRRLGEIVAALGAIPHVAVIRIHSRVPVVDPARITADMVAALKCTKAVYVVVHCNHAREITPLARDAIAALVDAGIPMLSQTVLLRGINDHEQALGALMRALVANRIKPYYLHHGDLARGTGHFRTSVARGRALMQGLRKRLSGLCQPDYVLDIPGGFGKVPVGPNYMEERPGGGWIVTDIAGRAHIYREGGR